MNKTDKAFLIEVCTHFALKSVRIQPTRTETQKKWMAQKKTTKTSSFMVFYQWEKRFYVATGGKLCYFHVHLVTHSVTIKEAIFTVILYYYYHLM